MRSPDGFRARCTGPRRLGAADRHCALPDKPSIAVLPFLNLSGDPEQDYFADGVVEDIITALSRIRWLFVIARNSSFTYKGRAVDVKQVGRELGVRYVLEGSVRKAANRVRITGQLIDATTGAHLWAERFEGTLDDIFELQDQVAESVVGAIAPQLERAEIERAKRKPTESLDAYDYYLRGMANFHRGTREAIDEALALFHKAIELDPDFASAYGMAAWCHFWRKVNGWMTDPAAGDRRGRPPGPAGGRPGQGRCRRAHARRSRARPSRRRPRRLHRAARPGAGAQPEPGGRLVSRRLPADLARRTRRARSSASRVPCVSAPSTRRWYRMQAGMAMAHLFAGRFDEASAWAEKAFRDLPSFLLAAGVIAASHALAGRTDEARQAMRHLRGLDPALRISNLKDWLLLRRPEDLAMFTDGLRKAGLPE